MNNGGKDINIEPNKNSTSTQETEVRIESASRLFLNFINGGANQKNVQSLEDYIRNEVNLPTKEAFMYLLRFKGVAFLVDFYEIEHLQSIEDAVDDLIVCCQNNGGYLA